MRVFGWPAYPCRGGRILHGRCDSGGSRTGDARASARGRRGRYKSAMTRPAQKEQELAVARLFVDSAQLAATPEEHERPDVLLLFREGDRVLLEVTAAVEPQHREAHAAFQRLERATAELLASDNLFVHVVHHPYAWLKPQRQEVQRMAEALARFARTMRANRQEIVKREDLPNDFPSELAGIAWAIQVEPTAETSVHASGEQYHGRAPPGDVQAILDEKEQCVLEYREHDPDAPLWLLITTHTGVAERLIPDLLNIEHVLTSSFDRAFLLDGVLRNVRELRLAPP